MSDTQTTTTTETGAVEATREDQQPETDHTAVPAWDGNVSSLPADVQNLITGLRKENGEARIKARDAETAAQAKIAAALTALGVKPEGEDPVEAAKKAAQERDTATAAAAKAARELAVFKTAAGLNADASRLLDSTSFLASIDGLDPSADGEKISAAIKAALDSNPHLKATRAVGASGIQQIGGTGELAQVTEAELKTMSPEQIVEAQNKGLLKNLLGA